MNRVVDRDKGYARVVRSIGAMDGSQVEVGIFGARARRPYRGGRTVGEVAHAHAYGIGVPRRDFMGAWYRRYGAAAYRRLRVQLAKAAQLGKDPALVLRAVAMGWVREVRRVIVAGVGPPLAESTIKRKGNARRLRDTDRMLQAVWYRVNGR